MLEVSLSVVVLVSGTPPHPVIRSYAMSFASGVLNCAIVSYSAQHTSAEYLYPSSLPRSGGPTAPADFLRSQIAAKWSKTCHSGTAKATAATAPSKRQEGSPIPPAPVCKTDGQIKCLASTAEAPPARGMRGRVSDREGIGVTPQGSQVAPGHFTGLAMTCNSRACGFCVGRCAHCIVSCLRL